MLYNKKKRCLSILTMVLLPIFSVITVDAFASAENFSNEKNSPAMRESSATSAESEATVIVRIAVCPQNPPYQFLDETGALAGINIDIMNDVAKKCNYYFIYSVYETYSACLQAMSTGLVDVALGYNMNIGDSSRYYVTGELSNATLSVVARKSIIPYLEETKKVGAFSIIYEYGSINLSLLYSMGFKHLSCVSSQERAIEMLLEQKEDIFVGSSESINYVLSEQKQSGNFETLHSKVAIIHYAAFVSKSSVSLYRSMNQALEDIHANGTYENIYEFWVKDAWEGRFEQIVRYLFLCIVVSIFFVLIFLGVSYALRQKISEKTKMLVEANSSLKNMIETLQNDAVFRNNMLDSLPIGAVLFKTDYSIALMNPAAYSLCGLNSDHNGCTDVRQLPVFGQVLKKFNMNHFFDASAKEKTAFELFTGDRGSKYRCWMHLRMNEKNCADALMLVEDITREEIHRQKLFAIEKAATLNQVTAGIAHEIKNPLMTIKVGTSLVKTQWEDAEVRQAFTQFIPTEIEKINTLVESLLNYSKPPGEDFCALQIFDLVERCFNLASMINKDSKTNIKFSTSSECNPYVKIQKDLFRQALTNLLINAVWAVNVKSESQHAQDWKGEISGKIYADEKWIIIFISDNGIGMSKNTLDRCMEPFFTTKMAGTGLGMALVRQCVESNGGKMTLESRESEYTKISIRLPRYYPDAPDIHN